MNAGRELDAEIAEKVMGWKLVNYGDYRSADTPDDYADAARNDGWMWEGREGGKEAHQWHPSTQIADTWEVVEKVLVKGWLLKELSTPEGANGTWWCEFIRFGNPNRSAHCDISQDTAPLAICRAALEAAGGA